MKSKIKLFTIIFFIITILLTGCVEQSKKGNEILKDANELYNLVDDYNTRVEEND